MKILNKSDETFMGRCLQIARNGRANCRPNPMVGAVIVDSIGNIIGEGYHQRFGEAHAEVNAFRNVRPADEHLLADATLYVSLEPCSHYGKTPPCADLIVSKHVRRVVVGCQDPFPEVQGRGIKILKEAGIDVTTGVLEKECRWLNRRFFTFNLLHRPYILLKWAQTADNFIDDNGKPLAISTPLTRIYNHKLRAEEDAIVVGRITDEREHPQLNVRYWSGKDPVRFVLSHSNNIDEIVKNCVKQQLQSLIVEGGLATLQSFIDADLWDEIRVEKAPFCIGKGTPAPAVPENVECYSLIHADGNTIARYRRATV